jgi:hypothetical protein
MEVTYGKIHRFSDSNRNNNCGVKLLMRSDITRWIRVWVCRQGTTHFNPCSRWSHGTAKIINQVMDSETFTAIHSSREIKSLAKKPHECCNIYCTYLISSHVSFHAPETKNLLERMFWMYSRNSEECAKSSPNERLSENDLQQSFQTCHRCVGICVT